MLHISTDLGILYRIGIFHQILRLNIEVLLLVINNELRQQWGLPHFPLARELYNLHITWIIRALLYIKVL